MVSFDPLESRADVRDSLEGARETANHLQLAQARVTAASEASKTKREATIAFKTKLEREDVLLYRRQGLVPLAIADEVGISLSRVVKYLSEEEKIPSYLITNRAPKKSNDDVAELKRLLRG